MKVGKIYQISENGSLDLLYHLDPSSEGYDTFWRNAVFGICESLENDELIFFQFDKNESRLINLKRLLKADEFEEMEDTQGILDCYSKDNLYKMLESAPPISRKVLEDYLFNA